MRFASDRWMPLGVALFPITCGTIATAFFVVQGGFGGGHGNYDGWIYLLGLPAAALLESMPLPPFVQSNDILLIIWYPAVLNLLFLWAPVAGLLFLGMRAFKSSRG